MKLEGLLSQSRLQNCSNNTLVTHYLQSCSLGAAIRVSLQSNKKTNFIVPSQHKEFSVYSCLYSLLNPDILYDVYLPKKIKFTIKRYSSTLWTFRIIKVSFQRYETPNKTYFTDSGYLMVTLPETYQGALRSVTILIL